MALVERVLAGDRRALAQAITAIVEREPAGRPLLAALHPKAGRARIVGLTGAPGVGKSTLTAALTRHWRRAGLSVAIVAVDPTSPFSGGALLGDRIRMGELATDPGVFFRSLATRGAMGGLAAATGDVVTALDAAGFDRIIVETIGTGQAEVDVITMVHSCVVVLIPGMGDGVQAFKAGILEIADLFVINKADHEGAERLHEQMAAMLELAPKQEGYAVPILATVATTDEGIDSVADGLDAHWQHLLRSGKHHERDLLRARTQLQRLLQAQLLAPFEQGAGEAAFEAAVRDVAERRVDPHGAVAALVARTQERPPHEP